MRFLYRSLTARLVIFFLLLAIVPLVAIGYMAYDSGRQSIITNVEAHLESVVILKEQEIGKWVNHLEHTINWLATSPQTISAATALTSQAAGEPAYQAAHSSLVTEFRRMSNLGHLSPILLLESASGQIIAASDAGWEGQFRDTEPWFIQGKNGTYVSEIIHNIALGHPTVVVAVPVIDSDGQLLGVLAGHSDLEDLSEVMLERSGLGETGETYLVNQGNLLLTESRFELDVAFRKWVFTEGVNQALAGESGVGLYLDYRERPVIGAYRWLEDREMALLAEINQAEAFAPIVALRNTILQIGGSVALVVSLLGIFFARTITNPVRQLVAGAEEIGRGNLETRIEVGVRDEIGQLAGAFNEMAANLQLSLGETSRGQRMRYALSQAAQAVQRARTPEEIFETVGKEVVSLGFHTMVFQLTDDRSHLRIPFMTFDLTSLRSIEKMIGISANEYQFPIVENGTYHQLLSNGGTVFTEKSHDYIAEALPKSARAAIRPITALLNLGQSIYAPLILNGEITGFLNVTGQGLAETDSPAVTTFANQISIALENTLASAALNRRVAELDAINTITSKIVESAAIDEVLNWTLDKVFQLFQAEAAALFLLDENSEVLSLAAHRNVPPDVLAAVQKIKLGEGLTGQVAQTGKPAVTGRVVDYSGSFQGYVERDQMESIAAIPLTGHAGVIGVMSLTSTHLQYFDTKGFELLVAMGQQIAIGVEKARLYKTVRESEEKYKALVENATDFIFMIDVDDKVLSVNKIGARLFGRKSEEIIGKSIFDLFPEEIATDYSKNLKKVFETGVPDSSETMMIAGGRESWIHAVLSPIRNPKGDVEAVMGAVRDITESKDLQERLARSEKLAVLGQLAGGVGHELRNPLGAIKNAAYFLNMVAEAPDPSTKEMLDLITREVANSERIISDLLDFARTRPPTRQKVAINDVIQETLSRIEVPEQIEVISKLQDELPVILADPGQLDQIFSNIIHNGFQAMTSTPSRGQAGSAETPEGGQLTLETGLESQEWLAVTITDTGAGMSPEILEKIFEPLFTTRAKGIGLGLAIVRTLVEGHGGTIAAASAGVPGQGSCFTVRLPLQFSGGEA